jgi:cytoskeletal protein RodZ
MNVSMAELPPTSVGQRVKAHREKRGIALIDVAATTKMSKAALLAIERDDVKALPGGIFTRAFVRSYAQALGLDPDTTVRDFMAQFPGSDADPTEVLGRTSSRRRVSPGARAVLQFGVASLPLVIALIWFALPTRGHPGDALAADRVAAATSDIQAPAPLRPVATETRLHAEAIEASHQTGVLNLVLTMKAACWVSAETDGRPIVERMLNAGEVIELNADRVVAFTIGDASAVAMQINGAAARSLGHPGKVVSARIDASNFREFLAVP